MDLSTAWFSIADLDKDSLQLYKMKSRRAWACISLLLKEVSTKGPNLETP
ncbi:MAG: hypothetical protein ACLU4N_01000 [Butyricimonas faecihominis]